MPFCVVERTNWPPITARWSFSFASMPSFGAEASRSSSVDEAAAVSAGCVTSVISGVGNAGRT